MRETINYLPSGVCCKQMIVEIEDSIIRNVQFIGGCDGNHKGIRNLVIGMNINDVSAKLRGITCGARSTSCPDQLAVCLLEYIEAQKSQVSV